MTLRTELQALRVLFTEPARKVARGLWKLMLAFGLAVTWALIGGGILGAAFVAMYFMSLWH